MEGRNRERQQIRAAVYTPVLAICSWQAAALLPGSDARVNSCAHIGRSLVEDEDAGVLQQRAGHAQQLPLASAQVGAALNELRVQLSLHITSEDSGFKGDSGLREK